MRKSAVEFVQSYDVTVDRDKYLGGSDMPTILGINQFKSREDLLMEKAGLKQDTFSGNAYTSYGTNMEPVIRDYINGELGWCFDDGCAAIDGRLRYHAVGVDWGAATLLEVKTTSASWAAQPLESFETYIAQILLGLKLFGFDMCLLAVYARDTMELDPGRLHLHEVHRSQWSSLESRIDAAIDEFWAEVDALKAGALETL